MITIFILDYGAINDPKDLSKRFRANSYFYVFYLIKYVVMLNFSSAYVKAERPVILKLFASFT